MPLYNVDVPIWATAYIKADSEEEALKIAREQILGDSLEVRQGMSIDGRPFEQILLDPGYIWSFCPAMSVFPPQHTFADGTISDFLSVDEVET